ncbi:MAG: glycosyltransferase involved in cell wall biosynthesis [Dokdonia sp.]|jgi:glycosyltransferase involved in cell wall biosynthesis
MDKVLVITGMLPVAAIENKKRENDIVLVTEEKIKQVDHNILFEYLFTFPDANKSLARLSSKWESYYGLKKEDKIDLRGRLITLFPILILPKKVFFRNLLISVSMFIYRKRIKKLIEEFKPTILHAQSTDSCAFIAKKISVKYNIPYVVTLRGIGGFSDTRIQDNLNAAAALIAISPRQVKDAKELTNKKISLIPHGIDESFFAENTKARPFSLPFKLITVSRLIKLKNVDMVIRALSSFKHDFIFDIYGDGPEKDNLEKLINELGLQEKVSLKGFINNDKLPSVFQDYNLFVMPSFPETLGRVYFEAMASGLPIIASTNTGVDGLVTEGKQGYFIDPCNTLEFTVKFTEILENLVVTPYLIEQLSRNSKEYAKEYSWSAIVPKYLSIYQQN